MAERTVVKEVKGQGKMAGKPVARLYSDGTVLLIDIRGSYPHIAKPYAGKNDRGEDQTPKYGIVGQLPKSTHAPAKDLLIEVMNGLLKEAKVDPKTFPPEKKFLRNGDTSGKEENVGYWIVSAREERRPSVRDADRSKLKEGDSDIVEKFVGGHWFSLLIRPWMQNHKTYGKRVNAGLSAIQFVRKDETYGEGRISEDELDDTFDTSYEDDEENGGFDSDDDGLGGSSDDDMGGL